MTCRLILSACNLFIVVHTPQTQVVDWQMQLHIALYAMLSS